MINLQGEYVFYRDGLEIARSSNLVTTVGKQQVMRLLSGLTGVFGESFAFGTGATAATAADTNLDFEIARATIDVRGPDYTNNRVVFKATLPPGLVCTIYEVGLWTAPESANSPGVSRMLLSFDPSFELYTGGVYGTTNARFGAEALRLTAAANATTTALLTGINLDLSVYSNVDEFKLAYYKNDNNASSIRIRFRTDATNYFTVTLSSLASGSGYRIGTFTKANAVTTGSPDWASINEIELAVVATSGGSTNVDLDGLRVNDKDSFTGSMMLVSRSIPGTPVQKAPGYPLDVEYSLRVV